MVFYIYENWVAEKKAVIHREDCSFCNYGQGIHKNIRGNRNGKWHGPFLNFEKAYNFAKSLKDRPTKECSFCKPTKTTQLMNQHITKQNDIHFTEKAHQEALLRRRIKFVVEKGAMARLFKGGTSSALQDELFQCLTPAQLASLRSRKEYDSWLIDLIKEDRWSRFSQHGLKQDRWAYFAKLLNIVIYEIVSNRELFSEENWLRIRPCLHIPLDSNVFGSLFQIDPSFPVLWTLKGMTEEQYLNIQASARNLADKYGIPPIWFEDAWTS